MSFNVGPTLLAWMRRAEPDLVRRMREGDAHSLARWGHGNALAQVYHHVIMPLSPAEDRLLETRWAVADFERHFGRKPEGMWLSECAVDLPTLETLAADEHGDTGELWAGHGGEALGRLLAGLMEESDGLPPVTPRGFAELVAGLMSTESVRTGGATHPRLRILGAIEARLTRADAVPTGDILRTLD